MIAPDPELLSLLERAAGIKADETAAWERIESGVVALAGEGARRAVMHARLDRLDPNSLESIVFKPMPNVLVAIYFAATANQIGTVASEFGTARRRS